MPLAQTSTDAAGQWQVDLKWYEGPVRVVASGGQIAHELEAPIAWISPGATLTSVAVTPISHLMMAYGRYLIKIGLTPDVAFTKAMTHIHSLLGGIPHQRVPPQPWPSEGTESHPMVMTDSVTSALYISGLDELAQRYSRENNVQPHTVITLETLTSALAEDLEADGILDGLGFLGTRLKLRETPLTKDTLRTDLAQALLRFADSGAHHTVLTRQEVQPLAVAASVAKGPLFAEDARPLRLDGPKLSQCQTISSTGAKRPIDGPVRGVVKVLCQWEDPTGVTSSCVKSFDDSERIRHETGLYQAATTVFSVDTTGYEPKIYTVTLAAENAEGGTTEEMVTLQVDNNPPQLALKRAAVWTNGDSPAVIEICSDKPLRQVTPTIYGYAMSPLEGPASNVKQSQEGLCTSFIFDQLECSRVYPLVIRAEDEAGNISEVSAFVGCETGAPAVHPLSSLFVGDFGESDLIDLAEQGWGEKPAMLKKFYNRFDHLPQDGDESSTNLPVLRFQVDYPSTYGDGLPKQDYEIDYRYRYQGQISHEGTWRRLTPSADHQYAIPLAYQTLLPESFGLYAVSVARLENFIAQAHPQDIHWVEIRVRDEMGNENFSRFQFQLDLKSPTLHLSQCDLSHDLREAPYDKLGQALLKNAPMFSPHLRWHVPRSEHSWAPDPVLELKVQTQSDGRLGVSQVHEWANLTTSSHLPANLRPQVEACFREKRATCQNIAYFADGRCVCLPRRWDDVHQTERSLMTMHVRPVLHRLLGDGHEATVKMPGHFSGTFVPQMLVTTPNQREEWLFKHTIGARFGPNPQYAIEAHATFPEIHLQYPGLMVSPSGGDRRVPAPHHIDRDGSCRFMWYHGGSVSWRSD